MNEIVKTDTQSFLAVIEKAVSNPDTTPDNLSKFLDIQIKYLDKQSGIDFNESLARLQPLLPTIIHDAEIKHGDKLISTYARYETIDEKIRPLYTGEGFSLSFNSKKNEDGSVTYSGTLSHRGGHSRTAEMILPADTSGAKNAIQSIASTVSYAKRYLVSMLLNIVTKGEDDDGMAGGTNFINDTQIEHIEARIIEVGADRPKFLKAMGVNRIENIPLAKHGEALKKLKAKEDQNKNV